MRARTAVTAAALAAAAAATLSACGGGSGGGSGTISPAPPATTAATASASPASAGGTPLKIDPALKLPSDVTLSFDWPTPGDKDTSAVLSATANFMQSMTHGVVAQSSAGLADYAGDQALAYAKDYVQRHVKAKLTVTGTDRYYKPVVTLQAKNTSAEVTLCENQGKLFSKEIGTGKVDVTPENADSFIAYDIVLAEFRPGSGLWRASAITVKGRASQCQQ